MKKIVLFHRDFRAFTGGHLKVWDYFNHVIASPDYEPRIAFTPESKIDATNPWAGSTSSTAEWKPDRADILFLAGTDWRALTEKDHAEFSKPVINLIQHPRHAEAGSELRGFLRNRAVRICVSQEVAHAIKATNEVNGPVFVIPNGTDLSVMPEEQSTGTRKIDILICGLKAPDLAREVQAALAKENRKIDLLTDRIPRAEFLARLSETKIAVVLPRPSEGFYLPALEAMACGAIVVCPDCVGNRSFCEDKINCFRPAYDRKEIIAAGVAALNQSDDERKQMQQRANQTVERHSLSRERESFLRILATL